MMEMTININIVGLDKLVDAINRLAGGTQTQQEATAVHTEATVPVPAPPQPVLQQSVPQQSMPQQPVQQPVQQTPPQNFTPGQFPAAASGIPTGQPQPAQPVPTNPMMPQYQMSAQQQPVNLATQQYQVPVGQMPAAPAGGPQQLPTSHVAQPYTQEQLAIAMTSLVDAGKLAVAQGIMQQFGVMALTEIPPEKYPDVAVKLREAGASI